MEEPRRPILLAATAVFAGSALGAREIVPPEVPRLVLLVLALGVAAAWLSGTCKIASRALLVALLVSGTALRAGLLVRVDARAAGHPSVGPWRLVAAREDRDLGSVGRGTPTLAVAGGTIGVGESIAVLGDEHAPPLAAGPVDGPSRRSGSSRAFVERAPDEIVRVAAREHGITSWISAPLERARARLLDRVSELEDPLARGLVAGLLFGDLAEMPHGVGDLFVRTGTFHVLAISGLQVALVAVLLAGPIARALALLVRATTAGRWRPGFEPLRAAILILFVPIAGAGPPVTRSALAWIVGSLVSGFRARKPFAEIPEPGAEGRAWFMPRARDPLSLWSLALLCECLVHPDAPLSLSVELTYAATLGLILATGPIRNLIAGALPGGGRILANDAAGRERPEFARVCAQKFVDASLYSIAASLAAVLATSAIVWSHFGEWSPAGILATSAIAVPVAFMLVAGWLWLLAPGLVPEAMLELPGSAMIRMLEGFDVLPGTPCPLPPRPGILLALAVLLTLLTLARMRGSPPESPHGKTRSTMLGGPWVPRAAAAVWTAVLIPWRLAPARLEIHALDVGHGTAVLLRGTGGSVWVFDAGSRDRHGVDREALGPLLRTWDTTRIGIVLSHADRDHDGALDWLVERYPPAVWAGALPAQLDARLPHTAARFDILRGRMRLPDLGADWSQVRLELSRGLDVDGNEGSRCLEVSLRNERVVLCGDAEAEGLAAWLSARPEQGATRMLLFPHHGSDTELLSRLLGGLRPAEVWLSASGIPPVWRELERRGIRSRATSVDGPLRLELP